MNKVKFLASSILIFLCSFKQPKHCKLSDQIYFDCNREICKKTNLRLEGKGGSMMGDVQKIDAHYRATACLTVEQARRLYVEVVEGYLSKYNQNEQIRPYLNNYPFTIENIEVMIAFEDTNGYRAGDNFVALMFIGKKNQLIYRTYDHEKEGFILLHKEPYETAREIVMREREMSANQ